MATSVSDAERLRDAAERSGALVFVGHIFLSSSGIPGGSGIAAYRGGNSYICFARG